VMTAPATTIWVGIASDGIPSGYGCVLTSFGLTHRLAPTRTKLRF
jgi:hypothetical protein